MQDSSPDQITQILSRAQKGETTAIEQLLPLVYEELRALGASYFQQQSPAHTLQPTALVHEAFVKLMGPGAFEWESRAHFFAVAAKAMRQILTDHARRKKAAKRGGDAQKVTLSGLSSQASDKQIDLIALDEALSKLTAIDARQSEIVEMRFLAGLKVEEVASVLNISTATVEREWRMAKAWLNRELGGGTPA